MKIVLLILLTLLAGCASTPTVTSPECQHDERTFRCVKYIRNYDGDTITITLPGIHPLFGKKISVRVAGINTGEMDSRDECEKKKALEAKAFVEGVLSNAKEITIKPALMKTKSKLKKEARGRLLADVIVDGKNLTELLLENKLGVPYQGGKKPRFDWCK